MRPINIIVFSKDRALQLELFLRSFRRFVKDADDYEIMIIYTYSNRNFGDGYSFLMHKILLYDENIIFYREDGFKEDVLYCMDTNLPHTVFFVDDIVFKEPFDFYDEQMDIFDFRPDIACRSLRLNTHLDYCYALDKPMPPPKFMEHNIFDWTKESGDYGYPMSQDGHIFRTKEIYPMHVNLNYTGPNSLEGQLDRQRHKMGHYMICYDKSIIVNNPINRVQNVSLNRSGNISAEFLNEKFLDGFIIDLEPFVGMDNTAVHTEVTPRLIKA